MDNFGKVAAIGCAAVVGVCLLSVIAFIAALGIGLEGGWLPDSAANPVGKIHPRQIKQLEEMGIIDPGEKVLYFYSAAVLSIRDDGNLFTDRRVISYQEYNGKLEVGEATYDTITSIDFAPSDSWTEDSTITVEVDDGTWFILYVSTQSGGDRSFYEKLKETWHRHRNDRRSAKPRVGADP